MRFGWLTLAHSDSSDADARGIDEQLEQAVLADTLGFHGVWLTEHNFTGESIYCDPIVFAATLAARTERIRIGFAVIQLALRHPVRLAVQLALLDNLCQGRLDVGVGRGSIYNEYEYTGYGLTSADARERADETLEVLTRAWTESPFRFEGKYYQLSFPELRPRPRQAAAPAHLAQRGLPRVVPRERQARRADPDVSDRDRADPGAATASTPTGSPRAATTRDSSGAASPRRPSGATCTSARARPRPRTRWPPRSSTPAST